MKRFTFSSLRARLLLFVLVILAPVAGLMVYTASEQRQVAAGAAKGNAMRSLRPVAAQYERTIEATRQLLMVLGRLPEVRNPSRAGCPDLLAKLLAPRSPYANLGVIEPDGRLSCSALPASGPVNLSARPYFRRALKARAFAAGDYQVGRLTGKATINFAAPVLDDAGRVRAVVFAALDLTGLNRLAALAELPPNSVVVMIDRRGTVLARYPDPQEWVGRSVAQTPLVRTVREKGAGLTESGDLDGVPRLYAFVPLAGSEEKPGAYLVTGIPKGYAYADANFLLARNLLLLGVVAALTLLAAWKGSDALLLRRIRALVETTRQVRKGDWHAQTGLEGDADELGQLARAFDKMTTSLEAAQQRLLDEEKEKKRFYCEVIRAVTGGRFLLVEEVESPGEEWVVLDLVFVTTEDYREVRNEVRRVAREAGMTSQGEGDLVLAVCEAVTNAIKHASGGRCRIYRLPDRLVARVSDTGPGIHAENLPATILTAGFSTKVSLGMGYTLMLKLVDRVWLATGPAGTTLQLEKWIHPEEHVENPLQAVMERFKS